MIEAAKLEKSEVHFFGRTFRLCLLWLGFFELLSLTVHLLQPIVNLSSIISISILIAVFVLSLHKLEYGLYVALAELFVGSKGHLFELTVGNHALSIRIGLFVAIMLAWLIHALRNHTLKYQLRSLLNYKPLLFLGLAYLGGIIVALLYHNDFSNIYQDANAWLYFLYLLPLLSVFTKETQLNGLFQVLMAGLADVAIKSFFYLYVFTHQLFIMHDLYKWGRDTGWGEFTLLLGGAYRIFSQAHLFGLIGFCLILGYLMLKGNMSYRLPANRWLSAGLIILLAVALLGLSRTFWLALILTSIVLVIIAVFVYRLKFTHWLLIIVRLLAAFALAYALIYGTMFFPWPDAGAIDARAMVAKRFDSDEAAVSSRWSQLPTLKQAILAHPIVGQGWGATFTYNSNDPRIKNAANPTGKYTTFASEWGYLDMVMKFGLIGTGIYIWLLCSQFWALIKLWQTKTDRFDRALLVGLGLGFLSLVFTHGFSPYLNHPLGIGFIILLITIVTILQKDNQEGKTELTIAE